ncbi:MAG: helix-turn-helix domain-containing protein [Halobacteriales archaeon]|nr:helix-turn-helix domain-containing protein [Halobacteriales archaeon]
MSAGDDMGRLLEAEDPPFDDIMACVFGIQGREVRTYLALLDRPGSTVEELATALDRDRSNVNRALSRLLELELAERQRRLLDPGGYVYQYTATPLPTTKERLHEGLDRWAEAVHGRIDAFEDQQAAE